MTRLFSVLALEGFLSIISLPESQDRPALRRMPRTRLPATPQDSADQPEEARAADKTGAALEAAARGHIGDIVQHAGTGGSKACL